MRVEVVLLGPFFLLSWKQQQLYLETDSNSGGGGSGGCFFFFAKATSVLVFYWHKITKLSYAVRNLMVMVVVGVCEMWDRLMYVKHLFMKRT